MNQQNSKNKLKEDNENVQGNQLLDLPEREQEFAHWDVPASSSRESA